MDIKRQDYTRQGTNRSKGSQYNLGKIVFSEQNQKEYEKAFNEGRCFRCLLKGHKRNQCREPIRCFKCKKLGHKSSWCKAERESEVIKPTREYHSATTIPTKTYAQAVTQHKEPVQQAKQTLPAYKTKPKQQTSSNRVTMEDFLDVRPEESHVFMPTTDELRPQNEYLRVTGMVVMVQGASDPNMAGSIARRFARQFGGITTPL